MQSNRGQVPSKISIVIPTYNGASWLPLSIPKVDAALKKSGIQQGEIVVIDDGSTDDTVAVVKKLKTHFRMRVVSQKNGGRFLARKLGALEAKYPHILFIDTRIFIAPNGLKFLMEQIKKNPERQVWTSHVYLDKQSNVYARFWDGITSVAWRKYFSNPRDYSYGISEFDHYPKGTTCFFVPRDVIIRANEWFEKNTKDVKTSNDDTLLIRRIAEETNININPEFYCTYHARTNLKQYLKHVHHRGKVFVDGFLRRDGNRFYYPLLAFLVLSVLVPICLIVKPSLILPALLVGVLLWLLEPLIIMLLGISYKDALSVFILSPIFAVTYGAGIWKETIKLYGPGSQR